MSYCFIHPTTSRSTCAVCPPQSPLRVMPSSPRRSSTGCREARHLRELLDRDEVALAVVVRLEILAGASRQDLARLRCDLAALPTFSPTSPTWRTMESWLEQAASAG